MGDDDDASLNKGAWTAAEDRILSHYVELHGPRKWKKVALQSGLKRCGKSCRLRWLNYLRPDIKRGNMSAAEDDLILRLHRLLGNRWSLIAKRIPGRTDNEIKNYWNAHLRKKATLMEKLPAFPMALGPDEGSAEILRESSGSGDNGEEEEEDECFDFLSKGTHGLEWVKSFLELEDDL